MTQEMTPAQAESIANLPPEVIMLKMENESIMAVARTTPRDPMKIVKQLRELIDAYPAAADEALYSKPVGTVTQITCGNGRCGVKFEVNKMEQGIECPACGQAQTGQVTARKIKKFAEGLSIRAAESIRSIYGYTRLATTTAQLADGKVRITGVLVDFAAGNITSDERIISPWYKSRGGSMAQTPEDRFLNVTVKAEKAKLRRDIILDNTPGIVKAMFRDDCEKKLLTLVCDEQVQQKILPAFLEYGINADQLDQIVGRPSSLGWRESERLMLLKIINALKNEETTAAELLDGINQQTAPTTGPLADLTSAPLETGDVTDREKRTKPKPAATKPAKTTKPKPKPAEPPARKHGEICRDALLELAAEPMTIAELADAMGEDAGKIRAALADLTADEAISRDGDSYYVPAPDEAEPPWSGPEADDIPADTDAASENVAGNAGPEVEAESDAALKAEAEAADEEPTSLDEIAPEAVTAIETMAEATTITALRNARKTALACGLDDDSKEAVRKAFRDSEERVRAAAGDAM